MAQIGNIFSGLYLSVRNTSTVAAAGLTAIRKPREAAFEAHVPGSGLMFSTGLGGTQEPPAGSTALANTTAKLIGAGGTQKPAAGSTGSSSDLAAHTSLGGARTGCAGHDSLRSTSQRAQWCQEAYLQDKLRAGAAAVKVREAWKRRDQGPLRVHCTPLRGFCSANVCMIPRVDTLTPATQLFSWMGCACCLVSVAHTRCVQGCMHACMHA